VNRPRGADDFTAIRARMEELRPEREAVHATGSQQEISAGPVRARQSGPFRAYDRQGLLVSTIYMVPIQDLDAHKMMEIVEGTPIPVDHVEIHYTSGHPGVPEPHYHVILWHVSPERARNLF